MIDNIINYDKLIYANVDLVRVSNIFNELNLFYLN